MMCKEVSRLPFYINEPRSCKSQRSHSKTADPRWDLLLLVAFASFISLAYTATVGLLELKLFSIDISLTAIFSLNNLGCLFCLQSILLFFSFISVIINNHTRQEWLHLHTVLAVLVTAELFTGLLIVTYTNGKEQSNANSLFVIMCILVSVSLIHMLLCFAIIMIDLCRRKETTKNYYTLPIVAPKRQENIYTY